MAIEIAQKIEAMEAEMVRTQEVRQNALKQAQEAEAILQRQAGYIAGLREIQEAEARPMARSRSRNPKPWRRSYD